MNAMGKLSGLILASVLLGLFPPAMVLLMGAKALTSGMVALVIILAEALGAILLLNILVQWRQRGDGKNQ